MALKGKGNHNPDLIEIAHLERIQFEDLHHSNPEFFTEMVANDLQAYSIGNTMFGCLVAIKNNFTMNDDNEIQFQFFEYRHVMVNGVQKKQPIIIHEFSEILEICDSEYLSGLLFHLDIIKEEPKNES